MPSEGKLRAEKDLTISGDTLRDHLTAGLIHTQHVMIDSADLRVEVAPNRRASSHICLHDVPNDFNGLAVLKNGRVVICLLDNFVPLYVL